MHVPALDLCVLCIFMFVTCQDCITKNIMSHDHLASILSLMFMHFPSLRNILGDGGILDILVAEIGSQLDIWLF